jgi:hypothetical protein
LSGIARVIGRYVQLTWQGRELRGECPFCGLAGLTVSPAHDNRAKQYDAYWPDHWRCLSCGSHELGNTAEGFIRLAREAGLTEGRPRKPMLEPRRAPLRWQRVRPPLGSRPNLAPPWLGTPLAVREERDGQGRCLGYRATYSRVGMMCWIFIRYAPHDPGMWKCRRPALRERIAALFPDVPGEVARRIQGRARVSVTELLAGENASGYRAKAIAWALRALGWTRRREGSGQRRWYYVPIT